MVFKACPLSVLVTPRRLNLGFLQTLPSHNNFAPPKSLLLGSYTTTHSTEIYHTKSQYLGLLKSAHTAPFVHVKVTNLGHTKQVYNTYWFLPWTQQSTQPWALLSFHTLEDKLHTHHLATNLLKRQPLCNPSTTLIHLALKVKHLHTRTYLWPNSLGM